MANIGKDFENQIRECIITLDNVYYLRIPDPPQSFKQNSDNGLRFSNNNPYDFIIYSYPYFFTIENKSTSENRISWSMDKKNKNVSIKTHQIHGLFESYKKGAISGFIFNFRKDNITYFMHILDFMKFIANSTKKSINIGDVKSNNGILIPQTLKRVKYNYDMQFMIDECASRYEYYKNNIP